MPAKPTVEVLSADGMVELDEALSFSVANVGDADAEIRFDLTSAYAPLPSSSSVQFEFVGARYEGRLYVRFLQPEAAAGPQQVAQPTGPVSDDPPVLTAPVVPQLSQKVSVIKITHHC